MSYVDEAPPVEQQPQTLSDLLGQPVERPRRRLRSLTIDKEAIAKRIIKFYDEDLQARQEDRNRRIQRYAKFRMWSEGKDWPWPGSSDLGMPDMMEKSQRTQDTLHNAIIGSRPKVLQSAATLKHDEDKQDTIDKLIDYQVFVEQEGENKLGDAIDAYVNDGVFTIFTPWVKELRDVHERTEYDMPPDEMNLFDFFEQTVNQTYPTAINVEPDKDGWEWNVFLPDGEAERVCFYTGDEEDEGDTGGKLLAITKKYITVYEGPVIIPKDYDDVIYMPGAANLQGPGPSNPGGAPHVILRDSPTIDEVMRLVKTGYYDIPNKDDLDKIKPQQNPSTDEQKKQAVNTIQGQGEILHPEDKSQGTVTRLMCFDRYDLDGDGIAEDVVFWVLVEAKIVLRAKYLSECFPFKTPRRPFAEASFIAVPGRREGISMLEILEGIHDQQKTLYDVTSDSAVLGALPVGFYRAAGSVKPETINFFPGMMYPLGDPMRDVAFPAIGNPNGLGMLLNLLGMLSSMGDRATMVGDFQLGRVPAGKSAALRTTGSMAMLQAQGDARPERILRRMFIGLSQLWANIHELNCAFLPKDKQIRLTGLSRPDQDPFMTIEGREKIDGQFKFEFQANAFNTSKAMMQQSLMQLASVYLSPLFVQAGTITPENIYALGRDIGKAFGIEPTKYLTAPSAEASLPLITAQDAITQIMADQMPYGRPGDPGGTQEHLQALAQFFQSDEFGMLTPKQVEAFKAYAQSVMERMMAEQMQQMLAQAAAQYQQGGGQPGQDPGGAPAQNAPADPNAPPPQVSGGGEQLDETLPTAGGGGQEEAAA